MASEKTVETEEAVTEKVETETEEIEEIQTEEAETETEETETGEIETEEIETEEVEIEETEIEETETEESKDRHKKSVNLNTTEQIKDLAGRIELAFAVFDTTNNTFTNQQYIYQPAIYKTSDGIYHIVFGYYDLNDADEFILAYQETVEANDLVLENVSASEQNYANGRQTATISVGNEGVKDASGFSVDVYEDDDWIDTVDVNESIASGEEKEIEITFSKSVSKEVQTYRFVINQDEDRNTKNNEQEIKLGYADVSLKTTEYYHDNIIDVYAQISNFILLKLQQKMKFVREITSTYCCYRH